MAGDAISNQQVMAREAMDAGRLDEAINLLRSLLAREPDHIGAHEDLLVLALKSNQADLLDPSASRVLSDLRRRGQAALAVDFFRMLAAHFGGIPLGEHALLDLSQSAHEAGDAALSVQLIGRLIRQYPGSGLMPRALWQASLAQESAGRPDLVQKSLRRLIEGYPSDPLAEGAREKLQQMWSEPGNG
jgi:tetratricopeptide (TPR) repeat protein